MFFFGVLAVTANSFNQYILIRYLAGMMLDWKRVLFLLENGIFRLLVFCS